MGNGYLAKKGVCPSYFVTFTKNNRSSLKGYEFVGHCRRVGGSQVYSSRLVVCLKVSGEPAISDNSGAYCGFGVVLAVGDQTPPLAVHFVPWGKEFYPRLLASEARQRGFVNFVGSLWTFLASLGACPSVHMSACAIVDSQRVHQAGAPGVRILPHPEVMREKSLGCRYLVTNKGFLERRR